MAESPQPTRRLFINGMATTAAGAWWIINRPAWGADRPAPLPKPIFMREDRPAILMADAAVLRGSLKAPPPVDGTKRFHVSNWKGANDSFTWRVETLAAGEYAATALIKGIGAIIEFRTPDKKLFAPINTGWNRIELGLVSLGKGVTDLTLQASDPGRGLELYSLELAAPDLKARLWEQATAIRSDTAWMRKAQYGLQFHWTSRTQPRHGKAKAYPQAVRDFPVQPFAQMVHETGAGYVTFTTSHADYFFPAPIKAIDRIMPGRTTERDLVRDLIDALGAHGIRLMLYYNLGQDHWREPDGWWVRSGFNPDDPMKFIDNWCAIISEVGQRYGKDLAGWFFDGSCVFYPLNPDFKRLTLSAKAGNPDRVVCYNAWIWPRCTDFQDYRCGEGYPFLKTRNYLPPDGTGIFTDGPHKGLQAHTNFTLEDDWCHDTPETPIPLPGMAREVFVRDMVEGISRGIVPSVNLKVYQDGDVSEASLEYIKAVKQLVKAS